MAVSRTFGPKSGKSFEWLGMPSGGFMQFIPLLHPSLTRRLERLIIAEIKRDTAQLRRRHQQRQTGKKSTARKSG
jgi:hypothetical protein